MRQVEVRQLQLQEQESLERRSKARRGQESLTYRHEQPTRALDEGKDLPEVRITEQEARYSRASLNMKSVTAYLELAVRTL